MAEGHESGDWRKNCDGISDQWTEARRRKFLTDVNFLVGEGKSSRCFSAHKNVLAFSSSVFGAMFFGELPEKNDPIVVLDVAAESFEAMLSYIYGEKIQMPTIACAAEIFIAADKYSVHDLKTYTRNCISDLSMDDEQFWEIIVVDEYFHIPVIQAKCLEYIAGNASSLVSSSLFSNVSTDVIEEILQLDEIEIADVELLLAVVRWGMNNTSSATNLKAKLEPLLSYIRFSDFTPVEFCGFLNCHPGLIDSHDSLAILKHLVEPSVSKLPTWCSTAVDREKKKGEDKRKC